jgi:S-adenosylmethionine uptake transporter
MIAMMYFIHVFAFFLSMKYAEMSTVAPFDYTRLVFTCILAYFLIGDIPQYAAQYIGYIMIICSGVLLTTAERRKRKKEQLEVQIENV